MPWLVALEINKILKPGGITFHSSHFAWPVHESPWDFWRFTEEGFKVLFSSALGFKTKKTIYFGPLRMHPNNVVAGQENFPMYECYGGVSIFTQKIDEVNIDKFRWDVSLKDVLDPKSEYPRN